MNWTLRRSCSWRRLSDVGFVVKIREHPQNEQVLNSNSDEYNFRIITAYKHRHGELDDGDCELHHLKLRNIFFPPKRFFQLGLHRTHEVVAVHQHMCETVEQTWKYLFNCLLFFWKNAFYLKWVHDHRLIKIWCRRSSREPSSNGDKCAKMSLDCSSFGE